MTPVQLLRSYIEAATNDQHRIFVRFLYLTAVRVSEALFLRWRDITATSEVTAEAHIVGKGGKHRDVFIPQSLWCDLAEMGGDERRSSKPVFSFIKNRLHALRIVESLAKVAEIDKLVTPHSFRHAHISHALKNGASLAELRDQAGHANISTTSLYAHADQTRATASRLNVE